MITTSIAFSFFAGIIYGCSFALQQRSIFVAPQTALRATTLVAFFFTVRLATLAAVFWHLLHSPEISSILIVSPFVLAFWIVIFGAKVIRHERSGSNHQ